LWHICGSGQAREEAGTPLLNPGAVDAR